MSNIAYTADFDSLDAPVVRTNVDGVNTDAVNASVSAILADAGESPIIDEPTDSLVELPSGGEAQVRELNGEDEEALARINRVTHTAKFLSTLLERGVETVNGERATAKVLKDLLLGDREALVLGIRIATFGKSVEFANFTCPGESCGEQLDVEIDLSTIPSAPIAEPEFEVALWKGGTATVRLPDGHDQESVFDPKRTSAEQNTLLLSRCVVKLPAGKANEKLVRQLGVQDRRRILDEIVARTGGPQYDKVTFTHNVCGTEVPVVITAGDLFRDI